MEEHRREVGKRIAALREAKGLSQPQLAFNAGISQPSLWAIENGKTVEVTARTFIALCRALDTTWEHLWEGAEAGAEQAESEAQLVAIYRQLAPAGRMAVLQSAHAVRSALPPPKPQTILISRTKGERQADLKKKAS